MKKTIQIDYTGIDNFTKIKDAANMANKVLKSDEFYSRIAAHISFDHSDISPAMIAQMMRESDLTMTLALYYSLSPVRNIDGYDDEEHPNIIHLNLWKIDRSPESMCNTMIHSCVHAINACHAQYYFGHGDNSIIGKENTAPYWIGALAQRMVSKEEPIIIPLEHDLFESRISAIKKQFTDLDFIMA